MAAPQQALKRGGRFCVCSGPGGVSCKNTTHKPGIIMHKFPLEKTRVEERRLWTKFVRRHRPNFSPTPYSVVCSAHFEASCYPQCYSIDIPENLRPKARYLKPEALPTIDAVLLGLWTDIKTTPVSKRRSISKVLLIFKHMGLVIYSARTSFRHQTKFLFPVILKHCMDSRES